MNPEARDENVRPPFGIPNEFKRLRPTIWEERWSVRPMGRLWAIHYEPIGRDNADEWKQLWRIIEIHDTKEEAEQRDFK